MMSGLAKFALFALVVFFVLGAWQMYGGKLAGSFRFWMLGGLVPFPLLVLGVLALIGGYLLFIHR